MKISSALVSCCYVSFAEVTIDAAEAIAKSSRMRNTDREITGGLIHTGKHFFQYFEGPETSVLDLSSSIDRDPRHRLATPFALKPIDKRQFSSWAMGFAVLPFGDQLLEPLISRKREVRWGSSVVGMLKNVLSSVPRPSNYVRSTEISWVKLDEKK